MNQPVPPARLGARQGRDVLDDLAALVGERGLKPGDRIVIEGLQHARPGEKVQVDETPLPLAQTAGQ